MAKKTAKIRKPAEEVNDTEDETGYNLCDDLDNDGIGLEVNGTAMGENIYLLFESNHDDYPKTCNTVAELETELNDSLSYLFSAEVYVFKGNRMKLKNIDGCWRISE